jgi:hypothetical protein
MSSWTWRHICKELNIFVEESLITNLALLLGGLLL